MKRSMSVTVFLEDTGIMAFKALRSIDEAIRECGTNVRVTAEIKRTRSQYTPQTEEALKSFQAAYPDSILRAEPGIVVGKSEYAAVICTSYLVTKNFFIDALGEKEISEKTLYLPSYSVFYGGNHGIMEVAPRQVTKSVCLESCPYPQSVVVKGGGDLPGSAEKAEWDKWYADNTGNGITFEYLSDVTAFLYVTAKAQTHEMFVSDLSEPAKFLAVYGDISAGYDTDEQTQQPATSIKKKIVQSLENHRELNHYIRTQIHLHKGVVSRIRTKMNKQTKTEETVVNSVADRLKLTKRMLGYWGDMNHIEPMIRTSWDILAYIPVLSQRPVSPLIERYATFCKQFKDRQFTDIILVPHLVRGGADLTALNLARALQARDAKTLVIATVDVDSPWRSLAEEIPNLAMIELHKELRGMGQDQIMQFCLNVVRGWNINRISVINSEVGYRLAAEAKSILKQLECRIYLHTYAYDMTEDGYIFNMIPNGIVKAYPGVDALVTDSKSYAQQLKEINGFESSKTKVLYQPIESKVVKKADYSRKNKVLWAGRVGDAKLVEVMVEIGRCLGESGIELHVYGAIDPAYRESDRFLNMIANISSIKYHGSYDGFGSIDTNRYDLFLMTTKNEGMPNVVLEAGKAGIFTVAPRVGGIPECIQDGKNGSLVNADDRFNPDAYLKCILDAYKKDLCFTKREINKTNRGILKKHTLEAYTANAQKITR